MSAGRQGTWEAGLQSIEESDVWMAAGFNPLVSVQGLMGFFPVNPNKEMQRLRARGTKFIVIDPRRTETARYADIHLQIYPGEDVTLAAGLLHVILNEGWHDAAFCDEHVDGLDALRQAVAPFTPSYVAGRAGIEASQLIQSADLFAHQSRRGFVTYCTGPNMVHRSTLAAQLYDSINIVCGRFRRQGEPVHNPGVLTPRQRLRAQVIAPQRPWNQGPRSRVGEYHGFFGQMMTNTLSEEILRPGPGRIRALVVLGGNPLAALPDRLKAERALRDLELLVVLDPRLSGTAKLADYVIAPKVLYEREDMTNLVETSLFPVPFTQYSSPAAEPPANSEVVDDWYVFWSLARRMGKSLTLNGHPVRMDSVPTTIELLKLLAAGSQVPIAEIASHRSGAIFNVQPQFVEPADAEAGRFSLVDAEVRAQLSEVAAESIVHGAYTECGMTFTHRLCVRRMREVINSYLHDVPAIRRRLAFNPAWMHPADAKSLGLNEGDAVMLIGSQGALSAHLEFDDTVRPGSVAISHCWGDAEDGGANTNLLTSTDQFIEPINAMARMTGIPVNIVPDRDSRIDCHRGPPAMSLYQADGLGTRGLQ